jgi:hypothetical protein
MEYKMEFLGIAMCLVFLAMVLLIIDQVRSTFVKKEYSTRQFMMFQETQQSNFVLDVDLSEDEVSKEVVEA